ncbi:hypothetical protein EUTSA_v10025597mg [Eutrema salsugineum]|uniref:F-box domain-containing protein n=2 Tax=Eutrema salsugineum TaxID=72664 RepID=V4MLJ4_EUTSA|nr:hypothetical protein EUTSA_v10025597mg [Eutrema salsugineum]
MSSPETKRKKPSFLSQSTPNLSLPDDLLLSCFARVSKLYHPYLFLVSKSLRSLLASPDLYKTRALLNRTESCLYVCLRFLPDPNPNPRWFTLSRRPNRTLTTKKKKPSDHLLVPFTSPHYTPLRSSYVAVGSDIYEIGGLINGVPSARVSILNCRSNTWHKAPNMEVAREHPHAIAIDEKILVKGGLRLQDSNLPKWIEVFDPKTQTWMIVPFLSDSKDWKSPDGAGMAWQSASSCVIDDVSYNYCEGLFKWFDEKVREWRILKGMEGLPKYLFGRNNTSSHVQLVDYGGKMAVLWDRHDSSSKSQGRVIWCAEISLERCNSEEISGTVEWSEAVLKASSFAFVHVLAATL